MNVSVMVVSSQLKAHELFPPFPLTQLSTLLLFQKILRSDLSVFGYVEFARLSTNSEDRKDSPITMNISQHESDSGYR